MTEPVLSVTLKRTIGALMSVASFVWLAVFASTAGRLHRDGDSADVWLTVATVLLPVVIPAAWYVWFYIKAVDQVVRESAVLAHVLVWAAINTVLSALLIDVSPWIMPVGLIWVTTWAIWLSALYNYRVTRRYVAGAGDVALK